MAEILHQLIQLIGSLSHYLQGFIHPRWLFGISAINSSTQITAAIYFTGVENSPLMVSWLKQGKSSQMHKELVDLLATHTIYGV